ncbi:plasmid replication DNA-binding protein KfrA [Pseudoduganella flava]|uniref:Plasmid replication DNA-binding protein KfrA n=1 Tax=Pseudoduganella flava TaxID=871742 RepID=A0A562Q414_9BURK|nr:DNA-binding protein [Pseudoduganella flava]QGZ41528.1 hypothetical protein GO485_22380 [Pseudoduganella flava]TWI51501.1 plasmid replication DNA-binding protein KfrA [Pseudoduganella flava]
MARTGLTKTQVREIRAQLLAAGRHPSADAVRRALGDTGSMSTIHKYLKELAAEDPAIAVQRDDTVRQLHAIVERLADQLHADAERRVRALQEEHARVLHARDAELAALRARVAELEGQAPHAGTQPDRPPRRGERGVKGFGDFGGLLSDSRCGRRDTSAFTIVLAGARSDLLAGLA